MAAGKGYREREKLAEFHDKKRDKKSKKAKQKM